MQMQKAMKETLKYIRNLKRAGVGASLVLVVCFIITLEPLAEQQVSHAGVFPLQETYVLA